MFLGRTLIDASMSMVLVILTLVALNVTQTVTSGLFDAVRTNALGWGVASLAHLEMFSWTVLLSLPNIVSGGTATITADHPFLATGTITLAPLLLTLVVGILASTTANWAERRTPLAATPSLVLSITTGFAIATLLTLLATVASAHNFTTVTASNFLLNWLVFGWATWLGRHRARQALGYTRRPFPAHLVRLRPILASVCKGAQEAVAFGVWLGIPAAIALVAITWILLETDGIDVVSLPALFPYIVNATLWLIGLAFGGGLNITPTLGFSDDDPITPPDFLGAGVICFNAGLVVALIATATRIGVLHRRGPRMSWRHVWAMPLVVLVAGFVLLLFASAAHYVVTPGPADQAVRMSGYIGPTFETPFRVAVGAAIVSVLAEAIGTFATWRTSRRHDIEPVLDGQLQHPAMPLPE